MSTRSSISSSIELPKEEEEGWPSPTAPGEERTKPKEQWSSPTPSNDEENVPPSKDEIERKNTKDPNLVDWEENDKANPRNWTTGYKSWITFQLGMLALAASLGSSIIAPAEPAISIYVGVSREVTVLAISLYMLVYSSFANFSIPNCSSGTDYYP